MVTHETDRLLRGVPPCVGLGHPDDLAVSRHEPGVELPGSGVDNLKPRVVGHLDQSLVNQRYGVDPERAGNEDDVLNSEGRLSAETTRKPYVALVQLERYGSSGRAGTDDFGAELQADVARYSGWRSGGHAENVDTYFVTSQAFGVSHGTRRVAMGSQGVDETVDNVERVPLQSCNDRCPE